MEVEKNLRMSNKHFSKPIQLSCKVRDVFTATDSAIETTFGASIDDVFEGDWLFRVNTHTNGQ